MNIKAIGGYFELELSDKKHYPEGNPIELNSARNCLEYILKARNYKKIYIPYYTCDVILEPIKKLNVAYEFYDVDFNLEPIFNYSIIKDSEAFLYTNYFGIKDKFINILVQKYSKNLIIDNAQALFSSPIKNIDTFYSPRKFVGVADGGYLYSDKKLNINFEKDVSYNRMSHLLKRMDLTAEEGYHDFVENDKSLNNQPIKSMSNITKIILSRVDYEHIKTRRKENFNFLHGKLKNQNLLSVDIFENTAPMIYPLRSDKKDIKQILNNERIYCASYWPNVLEWSDERTNSYTLAKEIIALPIDQRYSIDDMKKIATYV